MTCAFCGAPNPEGNRFCGNCGSPFSTERAGLSVDAGSNRGLPAGAGRREHSPATTDVDTSDGLAEKERRLVTILFADLVGSTSLGEMLDPEDVHDLIAEAHAALAETVEHYEGHVAKYLGDGLMALFGAPIAHEDDAERAVLAGLQMQRRLSTLRERRDSTGRRLELRVGITSGEVIAGEMAGSYDVVGDAANTAARLQGASDVGGLLVGEETMRLAWRRILFGAPRELTLKGKAAPVTAFPVIGPREQAAERWEIHGERTPLVGRERELEHVFQLWEGAKRGDGQLVTIVGDAGIGKSRLVVEAVERIQASADATVLRGRCLSYRQQSSLWLIADLLRSLCGVALEDDPAHVRLKLAAALADLLRTHDNSTRDVAADVFGEVLGLLPEGSELTGGTPQARRRVLLRSLRLILGAAWRGATVIVLEDLHWIDPGSADVLTDLMTGVPSRPLLVLTTQRPGWVAPWDAWEWPERVTLQALRREDAARLAGALVGGWRLSAEVEHKIVDRAGGNPLYVEELLRTLESAGGLVRREQEIELAPQAADRLPSTLTEILLARLDQLERQVRDVAQIASVVGRDFAVELLTRVAARDDHAVERALSRLQRAEIVFPLRDGDRQYVFRHVLLREAAYATLLRKRRQALHAATARALATLYPSDEHLDLIAYHYARTEEHMEAAEWLERAGDRAAAMYANDTALAHYAEARKRLETVGGKGSRMAALDEKRGRILRLVTRHDEAVDVLEEAAQRYQHEGDLEGEGRVSAELAALHSDRAATAQGLARIAPVITRLEAASKTADRPSEALASLYVERQRLLFLHQKYAESLEAGARAEEYAQTVEDQTLRSRLLARAKMVQGAALIRHGEPDQALRQMQEAVTQARGGGDHEMLYLALRFSALAHLYPGLLQQCRDEFQEALQLTQKIGDQAGSTFHMALLGLVEFHLGQWEAARQYLERSLDLSHRIGIGLFSTYPPRWLGQLCLAQGKWDEASRHLEEALTVTEHGRVLQPMRPLESVLAEQHLLGGQADLALARMEPLLDSPDHDQTGLLPFLAWAHLEVDRSDGAGHLTKAEELVRRGLELASRQNHQLARVDALRIYGMILTRRELWDDAEHTLDESAHLAHQMSDPYAEGRALYETGRLFAEKGDAERARAYLTRARQIFRDLGAKPYLERTEQELRRLDGESG